MIWWYKARAAGRSVVACVIAGVFSILFGELSAPVPVLTGAGGSSPLIALFIPLLVCVVVSYSFSRCDLRTERRAVRKIQYYDVVLCLIMMLTFILIVLIFSGNSIPSSIRNTIGLVGCTLAFRSLVPADLAAVPAILWTIVSAVLGKSGGEVAIWAWPMAENHVATSWFSAFALGILGFTVLIFGVPAPSCGGECNSLKWLLVEYSRCWVTN
ncbi:MAG: hypothetical protein ACRCSF_10655 [Mycobacteriaceae bacterium]